MTAPALIWADIRATALKTGWLRASRFALSRLAWPDVVHLQRLYVLSRPIPPTVPDLQADVPVTFRVASVDDVSLLTGLYDHPSLVEGQAAHFKRGDVIALALHEGEVVGHHMASFRGETSVPHDLDFTMIMKRFPITERDAYTHGFWVAPAYRGKRLAAPMGSYLMRTLYARGFRRIFTTISVDNEPSLRASYRMGSRIVGHMLSIQVLGLKYIHIKVVDKDPPSAEL